MFERKRHLKEVIETKSKQIANRDKLIDGQRAEIHQCQEENKALYNENKDLRFNSEELSELVKRIKNLAESNSYNNEKSILNKIKMSTPQFYNIGKGKRIEIKVCNEDSIQIRRVRCLLYYSNSGKKECIGKIWISPLIGYETCYFCMNVDIPLTKDEWHKLTFRIKRGKNYKDYKFLKQQVQEENI